MAASADDLEMIPGVRRLAETKRVWLLDQFGVLHDGVTAYPGAVDAARRLHESGAKLYVISNSSRRSTNTLQKLAPMGFDPSWFSGVVTSGEVTHQMLASRGKGSTSDGEESDSDDEFWASLGKKCVHFTWSTRGAIPLDGLDLETVTDPEEADFLLAHGTEAINGAGTNDEQRAAGCVDTPSRTCARFWSAPPHETCPSSSPTPTSSPLAATRVCSRCPAHSPGGTPR